MGGNSGSSFSGGFPKPHPTPQPMDELLGRLEPIHPELAREIRTRLEMDAGAMTACRLVEQDATDREFDLAMQQYLRVTSHFMLAVVRGRVYGWTAPVPHEERQAWPRPGAIHHDIRNLDDSAKWASALHCATERLYVAIATQAAAERKAGGVR